MWDPYVWIDRSIAKISDTNAVCFHDCGVEARNKYTTRLVIDKDQNLWFATETNGLFGYNYLETLDNAADDKKVNLNSGDFSGALPSYLSSLVSPANAVAGVAVS